MYISLHCKVYRMYGYKSPPDLVYTLTKLTILLRNGEDVHGLFDSRVNSSSISAICKKTIVTAKKLPENIARALYDYKARFNIARQLFL